MDQRTAGVLDNAASYHEEVTRAELDTYFNGRYRFSPPYSLHPKPFVHYCLVN